MTGNSSTSIIGSRRTRSILAGSGQTRARSRPFPILHLSKALGTILEDKVAELYLKTIGISSWDEVAHKDGIRWRPGGLAGEDAKMAEISEPFVLLVPGAGSTTAPPVSVVHHPLLCHTQRA